MKCVNQNRPEPRTGRKLQRPASPAVALLLLTLALASPVGLSAQDKTPPPPERPIAVKATLRIDDVFKDVDLVGRDKDLLFYRPPGGPEGASITVKLESITDGQFALNFDSEAAAKALMGERWGEASALLLPVITPLLPYLDVKENNGVGMAMQTGVALMKAARTMPATNEVTQAKITAVYQRAYSILKAVSKVEWSLDAELGALRAVQCLAAIGETDRATKELAAIRDPSPGDESFGLYWLAKAQLAYSKGQTKDAMNASVKSVSFDNKNIETFPDALFMTGRCYEDLLEWYRARDVYYEIARLFPGTSHGDTAREKLKYLMDKGFTKEKEKSAIETVFFGLDEDVNAKASALLKGTLDVDKPDTDENVDDDPDTGKSGKGKSEDGPKEKTSGD